MVALDRLYATMIYTRGKTMRIDLFRAYRNPVAILRVEHAENGDEAGLEIVTQVHSPIVDSTAVKQVPPMIRHEMHDKYLGSGSKKTIPIRVEFDKPEHFIRAHYVKWSDCEQDHPICAGNGRVATLVGVDKTESKVKCLGPARCPIAKTGTSPCMIDVRVNVLVDDVPVEIRGNSQYGFLAMLSGFEYSAARAGGVLSNAEMEIETWRKSTRGSDYKAFTAMDVIFKGRASSEGAVDPAMSASGERLLMDWEKKFAIGEDEFADLKLPDWSETAAANYAVSPKNSNASERNLDALFIDHQ